MKPLLGPLTCVLFLIAGSLGLAQTQQCSSVDPPANLWSVRDGDWSDPNTWNLGKIPTSSDVVQIGLLPPAGNAHELRLDISAIVAQTLVCNGTLRLAGGNDIIFTTNFLGIQSNGFLDMGTSQSPISATVVIRLGGKPVAAPPIGYFGGHNYDPRDLGLQVAGGGRWSAYGQRLALGPTAGDIRTFSELSQTANAGATSIKVPERLDLAGWQVGRKIVIAQTETELECDSRCLESCPPKKRTNTLKDQNEVVTIVGFTPDRGKELEIQIDPPLRFRHEVTGPPDASGLNRQSHVIYLERNIKIRSIDYADSPSHVLITPNAQPASLAFVEFFELGAQAINDRCGGQGQPICQPNRYPTHNHASGGAFEGLSYHHSKRAHLVLHKGDRNTVTRNTFYDEFAFQGASIWLALPRYELDATLDNVIEHNAILLPPRNCVLRGGGDLTPETPFNAGIFVAHPSQSINSNIVSGGFYAYWLNFQSPGADTAAITSFHNNTAYVGDAGLVQDSVHNPYRPTITQYLTDFKAWGYVHNILSFDANNVVWDGFKIFDSIGGIYDAGLTTASSITIDSRDGDTLLDTVTLRNSIVKGDADRGTNQLVLIGGDRLVVDADLGNRWEFKGTVSANVIYLSVGEARSPRAPPAEVRFDFGPADAPRGHINMDFECGAKPILNFLNDPGFSVRPGTAGTFCNYPITSTCGSSKDCIPSRPIGGMSFRSTLSASGDCPNFSPSGMITKTACPTE